VRLHAFTLRASWIGRQHHLYVGNAVENAIRDIGKSHGWKAIKTTFLPCGSVRVVLA
jgi:hypothetical protein